MKKKENKRKPVVRRPKPEDNKRVSRLPVRQTGFPNRDKNDANRNSHHPKEMNSTVFLTIKPFIKGSFLFAEGCISESQAVRAWMMIRIYNN